MDVQFLTATSSEWLEHLEMVEHDFYHLPRYSLLSASFEGGEPRAVIVKDGEHFFFLPIIIRKLEEGWYDATSSYGYPGPVVHGPEDGKAAFVEQACKLLREVLQSQGIISLFVRLHPILNQDTRGLESLGTLVEHGETVSINLRCTQEEHWKQTRSGHRNEINRAIRAGHVAYVDEEWKHYDSFLRIYEATMRRLNANQLYFFSDRYFSDFREQLGPILQLGVVEISGQVAAAALFTETGGLMQYHLSGTEEAFLQDRPTKLLLHHMRNWGRSRGNRIFHLGGGVGGNSDTLFYFKAGFSPDRHRFRTWRTIIDPASYKKLSEIKGTSVNADTDDVTGFFPLYRRPVSR